MEKETNNEAKKIYYAAIEEITVPIDWTEDMIDEYLEKELKGKNFIWDYQENIFEE